MGQFPCQSPVPDAQSLGLVLIIAYQQFLYKHLYVYVFSALKSTGFLLNVPFI